MQNLEKKCVRCSRTKSIEDFYRAKGKKGGRLHHCRECGIKAVNEYTKTKQGLTTSIYCTQKFSSKVRGHPNPTYLLSELRDWLFSQDKFHKIYDEWVESGHDRWKRPSCDRLDDYKPYSLDNIRIVTWRENWVRGNEDRVSGINKKGTKPVDQYSLEGEFIERFHSISEAERVTGIQRPNINNCCLGARKWAGGFIWKFAD